MEKHIMNLLNNNLRVIIPDFGAFIIRQKEPLVLVFNEFLRYNDGLLIDYIAKMENVDKDIARHQVTEFTENLVKTLEAGKEVKLESIGILRKTGDEKIEFVQAGKETQKKSSRKPQTQEKKKEESTQHNTVPPEIIPAQPEKPAKPGSESKAKTIKGNGNQPAKADAKAEAVKPTEPEPAKTEMKTPEKKPAIDSTVKKTAEPPKTVFKPQPPEKPVPRQTYTGAPVAKAPVTRERNGKKRQIGWIVLIVILIALINAWFIFNDQIKGFLSTNRLTGPTPDTIGRMVEAEPEIEAAETLQGTALESHEVLEDDFYATDETTEKTPAATAEKPLVSGEKKFYIVAGCFRDEPNAKAMVEELIRKGYKAQKFGMIGNLHAVSYSSFTNKEKALQELQRIREEVAPEAWMVYY